MYCKNMQLIKTVEYSKIVSMYLPMYTNEKKPNN